jgi:transposase
MMGQQTRTESLFYYFRLEDQIPEDHLLRLIDQHIDLSFVRERVKSLYSATGRPRLIPRYCCDCCWWAISTGLPVNGGC